MKKTNFAGLYVVMICLGTILSLYIPKPEQTQAMEEAVVIPKEAIRLRILANSDTQEDQDLKRAIRDEVNANITEWVKDLTSIETARTVIKSHTEDIQQLAERHVAEAGANQSVNVTFGKANFPTKLYGQFLYPAGEYEAIVITLGAGAGANWWCVLFPPLCFLDFSNGTAVSAQAMSDDAEADEQKDEQKNQKEETAEEHHLAPAAQVEDQPPLSLESAREEESSVQEPLYNAQDEEPLKVEKKWFFAEMMKDLFE